MRRVLTAALASVSLALLPAAAGPPVVADPPGAADPSGVADPPGAADSSGAADPSGAADGAPERQFDFWVGEWSVLNRHMGPDGEWRDGDTTRARITPVCGGAAILEEWAGPFRGGFQNGFSLRAWDPAQDRWVLLLSWTMDGNSTFGRLTGTFRHGRGEFFAGGGGNLTRYTFSDALADSVRWDSARSQDGGRSWSTDWIMEFARTRPASEVTQDELFGTDWTEGEVSPHPEARALDGMLGTWSGVETVEAVGGASVAREARVRCKLLNKDCLVLELVETRMPGDEEWDERLSVRGFVPSASRWESWRLSKRDTTLRRSIGTETREGFEFRSEDGWLERVVLLGDGRRVTELEVRRGSELERRTLELERDPR